MKLAACAGTILYAKIQELELYEVDFCVGPLSSQLFWMMSVAMALKTVFLIAVPGL